MMSSKPGWVCNLGRVWKCDEKLSMDCGNPPFYPFGMSLLWCAFLATDLCKAQRTTRRRIWTWQFQTAREKNIWRTERWRSAGSSHPTCESRLNTHEPKGTKLGYDKFPGIITNGQIVSGLQDPPKCSTIIHGIELGKPFVVLYEVGTRERNRYHRWHRKWQKANAIL